MLAPPPPTGTTVGLRSEVYPVAPPPYGGPRRLLFIGDSLTAGYGSLGHKPCASLPTNQDYAVTWGARTCTALGAECHTLAWSGRGLVRNYVPGEEPSTHMTSIAQCVTQARAAPQHPHTMPHLRESTGRRWDQGPPCRIRGVFCHRSPCLGTTPFLRTTPGTGRPGPPTLSSSTSAPMTSAVDRAPPPSSQVP